MNERERILALEERVAFLEVRLAGLELTEKVFHREYALPDYPAPVETRETVI